MKVLITGGAGFVGANLTEHLLEQGDYRVRILDNLAVGDRAYMTDIIERLGAANRVEVVEGDVRDPDAVDEAVEGVDAVAHLAAETNVVQSLAEPVANVEANALGALTVLEGCRRRDVERFIFASSNAAVGEQTPPIDEAKVPAPLSPYGAAKLAGEALCSAYAHSFGMQTAALRFANVYGPYADHKPSVVARFIRTALAEEPLVIYGDGRQTRDFIHARDIARAIEAALRLERPVTDLDNVVFQIATGVETPIADLAERIRALAQEAGLEVPELRFEGERKGEIRKNYADIGKARNLLGFEAMVGLQEGVREVWERWRRRRSAGSSA
ncbi:MAG: NAD-dependent epimerase/dehydratase family protein [Salinibacter sp.]